MSVTTFEGHVENGQIKLDKNVKLPEKARVFITLSEPVERVARMSTPRIVREPGAPPLRMSVQWKSANDDKL